MPRLIAVSNRVPTLKATGSVGGLAVGLEAALKTRGGMWFGWSGEVSDEPDSAPHLASGPGFSLATISLTTEEYDGYYQGYSNQTLWPLCHNRLQRSVIDRHNFEIYQRTNAKFAANLQPLLKADDTIWVHDYHLIPLGQELRQRRVKNPIGFFLHIPFPPPETFMALPQAVDLVKALSYYDIVGFQTGWDYRNFRDYVSRVLKGVVFPDGSVSIFDRRFRTGVFPIGIDVENYVRRASSEAARKSVEQLLKNASGESLVIGVDRLDYTKGLPEKFRSFELLLQDYPDLRGEVGLIQIAAPSRESVPEYKEIQSTLEGLTGQINGRFGRLHWTPIRYINRSFSPLRIATLYRLSRVGLVTPLRDGMNLVAKEYVASQDPADPGVLVLSVFAGAAAELDHALIVNPYDTLEVAQTIAKALKMPLQERQERWASLMARIRKSDIHIWCRDFLKALDDAHAENSRYDEVA